MESEGQAAFVTGAGCSMSRAIAMPRATLGTRDACADVDLAAAEETGTQLAQGPGPAVPCDITDQENVQAGTERAVAQSGRLDFLVNSAGIGLVRSWDEPTLTETPFSSSYIDAAREIQLRNYLLGRFAQPDGVAGTVLFPRSPGATATTGGTLNVNGGLWMD